MPSNTPPNGVAWVSDAAASSDGQDGTRGRQETASWYHVPDPDMYSHRP